MKFLIVVLFISSNATLGCTYIVDAFKVLDGTFYHEGWRYFIPIVIYDLLISLSVVLMHAAVRWKRLLATPLIIIIAHNVNVMTGEIFVPFVGIGLIAIASMSLFNWFRQS